MNLEAKLVPPKNETPEHFFLKQVAQIWLKTQKKCQYVASEVYLPGGYEGRERRSISDAVGIKATYKDKTIFNVEVKIYKADFNAGYCTGGHYNWVMTPKGLLVQSDLPKGVGLIEVDIPKFKWIARDISQQILEGVVVAKRPSKKNIPEGIATMVLDDITRQLTNNSVFKNPWIKQEGRPW